MGDRGREVQMVIAERLETSRLEAMLRHPRLSTTGRAILRAELCNRDRAQERWDSRAETHDVS